MDLATKKNINIFKQMVDGTYNQPIEFSSTEPAVGDGINAGASDEEVYIFSFFFFNKNMIIIQ